MKLFNKYLIFLLSLNLVLFLSSCDDDDATGHSTLIPTNPTISVTGAGTIGATSDFETNSHTITLTMSEPQIVDVAVHVSVTGGNATEDEDFKLSDHRVIIPAHRSSATLVVDILGDELIESVETFTITIGDEKTANATIVPVTAKFTINDYDADYMSLDLSWSTVSIVDSEGNELAPEDIADIIFTMVDDQGNVYEYFDEGDPDDPDDDVTTTFISDGAGFESLLLSPEMVVDGVYEFRASFYDVIDAGDLGTSDYDIDLAFGYHQPGVQTSSIAFPAALNIATNCIQSDYVTMARITKSGSTYTVEEVNENTFSADNTDSIEGTYTEINDDGNPQTSTVTMTTPDASGLFTISNFGFSSGWWCGHPDATIDLVVDGLSILFPEGGAGTKQVVGNLDNMCGVYGPLSVTLVDEGTWNPCSGVIDFTVQVTVAAGSFGNTNLSYTPQ